MAHTCVIAGGVLWLHIVPPTALPVGDSIEVSLVALHTPGPGLPSSGGSHDAPGSSDATPSGPQTDQSPATPTKNTDAMNAHTNDQTKKQDRAIRRAQGQTQTQPERMLQASNRFDSGKDAQPADNGQGNRQDMAGGGTGYGGPGNSSLPSPFGGHVNPRPVYPELARQRGQEGQVVLLVYVDIQGNPTTVLVEDSSEHALLDQAAVQAIQRWKFNPASRNGEAVPGTVRVPVTFRLQ